IISRADARYCMWFYLMIAVLFGYTIILIAFFMGWCTLIPTRHVFHIRKKLCHPRKEIPLSAVRSPRRNTIYIEIDSVSSSTSVDMLKQISRKYSEGQSRIGRKKISLNIPPQPHHYNDYLHPKYSLPPVKLGIGECMWEYEKLLKTPGRAVRTNFTPTS
ncbi:hypothetical protein Angca_000333, partial [Angiostrongylus cantonensis]